MHYAQPDLPAGAEVDVVKGYYKFDSYSRSIDEGYGPNSLDEVTLLGSGAFLPQDRSYLSLGTDGFGRSDTRAALLGYFGVDASSIVRAALGQHSFQAAFRWDTWAHAVEFPILHIAWRPQKPAAWACTNQSASGPRLSSALLRERR